MSTYLPPIENPNGVFWKTGYFFMRRKVMTPASVFSARMPTAFTMFYGKIGKLDKKLQIARDTAVLVREQVATVNQCLFCMDANSRRATRKERRARRKFKALAQYRTSPLFTESQRAALDYATELTTEKAVSKSTFDRLARHYSEREICDIVWLISSEHLFKVNNIALNIGSDGFCDIVASK